MDFNQPGFQSGYRICDAPIRRSIQVSKVFPLNLELPIGILSQGCRRPTYSRRWCQALYEYIYKDPSPSHFMNEVVGNMADVQGPCRYPFQGMNIRVAWHQFHFVIHYQFETEHDSSDIVWAYTLWSTSVACSGWHENRNTMLNLLYITWLWYNQPMKCCIILKGFHRH